MSTEYYIHKDGIEIIIGKRFSGGNGTIRFGFAPIDNAFSDSTFTANNDHFGVNMLAYWDSILNPDEPICADSQTKMTWGEFKNLLLNGKMQLSDNFFGAIKIS